MSDTNGNGNSKKLDGLITMQRSILGAVFLILSIVSNKLVETVSGNSSVPQELPGRPTEHQKYIATLQYYDSLGNAAKIRQLEIDITDMKVRIGICEKEILRLRDKNDRKE